MSSTKEQIIEAAKNKFAKSDFFIDDEKNVSVTLNELSRPVRDALNKKLFICDDDGKPIAHGKDGKPNSNGDEFKYKDSVSPTEEWLAACMEPKFTVEELHGPDWPISLKLKLFKEAQEVNGLTIKEAAGN